MESDSTLAGGLTTTDSDDDQSWEDVRWPMRIYQTGPVVPARYQDLTLLFNVMSAPDMEMALELNDTLFELVPKVYLDLPEIVEAHREWVLTNSDLGIYEAAPGQNVFFVLDESFDSLSDRLWIVSLMLPRRRRRRKISYEYCAVYTPAKRAAALFEGWPHDTGFGEWDEWMALNIP